MSDIKGSYTLGYTFFEDTDLLPAHLENAKHFDRLATGSTWCTQILERHGLQNVATVLQGIDPTVFFSTIAPRSFFPDRFIVFSGGKFEFRKGQDIVIRAFKVLQDRHHDVLLVASWYNHWDFSFKSMQRSPHIVFSPRSLDSVAAAREVLIDNGIDPLRAILMQPTTQQTMAHAYRSSDVGVFPNRAEGGTNLVLMEYMACGKPVLATASTGHGDIINDRVARVVGTKGEVTFSSDGESSAIYPEPDLEQAVEQLEWCYQNRDSLRAMADAAAAAMATMTWKRTAAQFLELLNLSR